MLGCNFLDQLSTRTQIILFLTHTAGNKKKIVTFWHVGARRPEKTGSSSYFRFSSLLKAWPPSLLDGLWLVLGRHYV